MMIMALELCMSMYVYIYNYIYNYIYTHTYICFFPKKNGLVDFFRGILLIREGWGTRAMGAPGAPAPCQCQGTHIERCRCAVSLTGLDVQDTSPEVVRTGVEKGLEFTIENWGFQFTIYIYIIIYNNIYI